MDDPGRRTAGSDPRHVQKYMMPEDVHDLVYVLPQTSDPLEAGNGFAFPIDGGHGVRGAESVQTLTGYEGIHNSRKGSGGMLFC